jgi:hypothetical protein
LINGEVLNLTASSQKYPFEEKGLFPVFLFLGKTINTFLSDVIDVVSLLLPLALLLAYRSQPSQVASSEIIR